jgi:NDP-sugar pyrophosphorylase family protein
MKSTPMFVLAGGFGTRLKSVVSNVPKPLAPVGDKPFLHYLLRNWIEQGVREFIFLLHYEADQIINYLDNVEFKQQVPYLKISHIVEPEPLGTGGAVKYALQKYPVEGFFLVTNADTWLSSGVQELMTLQTPSIATVAVPNVSRYGEVYSKDGLIEGFAEKRATDEGGQINAGMYLMSCENFALCEETEFSIETAILPELIDSKKLRAAALECEFIDIGIPEDYQNFCEWVST